MSTTNPPKALLTDVFGTVVDWRGTVTNFLTTTAHSTLNSPTASIPSTVRTAAASISWPDFAQKWRNTYYHYTRTFNPDTMKFKTIDQHHLESLLLLMKDHNIEGLWTDEEIHKISLIWHFLDPWPDSSPGIGQLNQKFITSTLSNGNTSLQADLVKHGNLPYQQLCSGEDFGAYKPHPNTYLGAAKKLGVKPEECALIAAHLGDLHAAKGCGYQTIYIERPQEEGWGPDKVETAREWVNMWVKEGDGGFEEVARRFGIENKGKI